VAWFTLWQAAASTLLTLVVALPGAYVFARYDFPGKRLLRALATVPFVLPTVVVGTAFLALVGPGGLLGVRLDGTIWVILAAHVFFNYAVVLRTVGGLWSHLDPRLEAAAACSEPGAGGPSPPSPSPCCARRWPPPPRWCSCSPSPRSG